jgi:hypothetical protein
MRRSAKHALFAHATVLLIVALGPTTVQARLGDCGQPLSDGELPAVRDCLAILRTAVGLEPCFRRCVCAVRGGESVGAVDALACLAATNGDGSRLHCACGSKEPIALLRMFVNVTFPLDPPVSPPTLYLLLALSADGTGQLWLLESEYLSQASVWPIQWRREGERIRIDRNWTETWRDIDLLWAPFEIMLDEPTEGTVSTSATGTIEYAEIQILYGDVIALGEIHDEPLVAETDADAPRLRLSPSIHLDAPFVGDTFIVRASEPVARDEMETRVRLLANGSPIAASVAATVSAGRLASSIAIRPIDYLPFDAELTVDPGGLSDPFGHEASWSRDVRMTMSDPGPASANPGFEILDPYPGYGWSGARISARPDRSPRWRMDHFAYLYSGDFDRMLGYFDLPPDAGSLRFSAAVYGGCLDEFCLKGVGVDLLTPGASRAAFQPTFEPLPEDDWDSCWSKVYSIPERRVAVDVADLAGQRVFVYARALWDWPCDDYTLTLDDFRVVSTSGETTTTTTTSTTTTTFACASGEWFEADFTDDQTATVPEIREAGITVTGSADLHVLHLNGLGVVGGVYDEQIDGEESVRFVFDRPALDAAYFVTCAANLDLDGTVGSSMIEAFGADGVSLGRWPLSDVAWMELRELAGCIPLSAFTVTAAQDGLRIGAARYRTTDAPLQAAKNPP